MTVRPANFDDAPRIAQIYNHYISKSYATFEIDPVDANEMRSRMSASIDGGYPFLVADEGKCIAGYAYGRSYRPRAAYLHSTEVSIYIDNKLSGRGLGAELYSELIPSVISRGFHVLIAGISLPNDPSVRLHEKFGFEKVAHFKEIGFKFERWIDVGYWQLLNSSI